ncbi:MAG TPA: response regulator transcription factor [Stellaceae bacterium]|nr:response regulator transcription factor [Stellaceae bacterium]
MTHTIAVVDDDKYLLSSISMALEGEGYKVSTFSDGFEALKAVTQRPVDLAVLDIKMPRMDGIELLGRIRKVSALPVIFLTSREDETDKVFGLRAGADDYITKPFSYRLLLARIHALLRRGKLAAASQGDLPIERGDLRLEPARHQFVWKGRNVDLTVTESLLLKCLVLRPGLVKTRNQLMDAAYGEHSYVDDRTVDSRIKRLRNKFKSVDPDFAQIETIYGVGYRYRDQ